MGAPKRVILNNTFRKGYYWRISDDLGKTHYYKYHKKDTKIVPVEKVEKAIAKRIQQHAEKELKKELPEQYPDGVTIHFRIDYGNSKHNSTITELKDTFVEIKKY